MKKLFTLFVLTFILLFASGCTEIIDDNLDAKQREIYLLAQEAGYTMFQQ